MATAKKQKQSYACESCGAVHSKWSGQCTECGEWNTLTEITGQTGFTRLNADTQSPSSSAALPFTDLAMQDTDAPRMPTGMDELDVVLGGGLVRGSAILIGGDPGIGKSTLLLQLSASLSKQGMSVQYITGEESTAQVQLRAKRLGLGGASVSLATGTSVSSIIASMEKDKPQLAIIDSIQTMYVSSVDSAPGTVSQLRAAAHELITAAKRIGTVLVLVGHVTKDGQIAGPKLLEHMVDAVLYFEGERNGAFRILRSVKNRFGAAGEMAVFKMESQGLQEVTNPSELFISGKAGDVPGSVIFAGIEGRRPVLLEIQALVAPTTMATPRRAVVGWDPARLAMLLAVLHTRLGVPVMDKEVYLNVAGGLRIGEPAADLAVAAALISAVKDEALPKETVLFGEVGLSGEVRPVPNTAERLREAQKLGFSRAIVPPDTASPSRGFLLQEIHYINELKLSLQG